MAEYKAQQRAEAAIAHNTCFERAVKALKVYYEDNRLLFKHHYDEVHKLDSFKDTVEDLDHLENRILSAIRGMESSNGYSAPQLLVAALEKMLTPRLARQWRQFTHDHNDPPPISQLLDFVHRQRKATPYDRLVASTKPDKLQKFQQPSRRIDLNMQETSKISHSSRDKCQFCNEYHSVLYCTEFQKLSPAVRPEKVKAKKLCFICLSCEHVSAQCSSRRRCKKCHRKHHTLIHRDNQGVPSVTIEDLPSEVAPVTSSVSMATQKTIQSYYACLPRTVLLMASAGNCRQKARTQLDPGAMLSLVTSRLAHSVHAKRIKNSSVNISGVGGDLHSSYQVELNLKSLYTEDFIFLKCKCSG